MPKFSIPDTPETKKAVDDMKLQIFGLMNEPLIYKFINDIIDEKEKVSPHAKDDNR